MAMTNREKLNAARAKYNDLAKVIADLEVAAANEVDTSTLAKGDTVTAIAGRGEKKREITGTVFGVKREDKKAAQVRILVGDDADAELITVYESDIRSVVKADAAV